MTNPVDSDTILDRILAQTAIDLDARRTAVPRETLERIAGDMPVLTSFRKALGGPGIAVIAEFKRASPSKGRFPVELDPAGVAREYVDGGAAAMSVLTDEAFFQGSLADLADAARVAHAAEPAMAILRKDFMIDEYQIIEAKVTGADAILLIVAVLDQDTIRRLYDFTYSIGLDALVEVHDHAELRRASELGAQIIGVNNRNLKDFTVDLAVTETLARDRPANALFVSESGIFTRDDVARLEASGIDAVLVGESLVRSADRSLAIKRLRGITP